MERIPLLEGGEPPKNRLEALAGRIGEGIIPDFYYAPSLSTLIDGGPQVFRDADARVEGVSQVTALPHRFQRVVDVLNAPQRAFNKWTTRIVKPPPEEVAALVLTERVRHDPRKNQSGRIQITDFSEPDGFLIRFPNVVERKIIDTVTGKMDSMEDVGIKQYMMGWRQIEEGNWNSMLALWVTFYRDRHRESAPLPSATVLAAFNQPSAISQDERANVASFVRQLAPSLVRFYQNPTASTELPKQE